MFRSVVWFVGDCTFKTVMPANVLTSGLSAYIESFSTRCLTEDQVAESERALRDFKERPVAIWSEHVRSLQDRFQSETVCPRCGAPLKQKIARRGVRAGHPFLGCSRYPACHYLRNLD